MLLKLDIGEISINRFFWVFHIENSWVVAANRAEQVNLGEERSLLGKITGGGRLRTVKFLLRLFSVTKLRKPASVELCLSYNKYRAKRDYTLGEFRFIKCEAP